ncbi:MAG: hypothetical protein OHK0019_04410 [Saprospiraceae bacterium]
MLIGIIFASILSAIALINSLRTDWNWFQSRMIVRKTALDWFLFPDDDPKQRPAQSFTTILAFAKNLEDSVKSNNQSYILESELLLLLRDSCDGGWVPEFLHDTLNYALPDWVRVKSYSFEIASSRFPPPKHRKALYKNLAKTAAFVREFDVRSRKSLEYAFDNLIESQYENLSLIQIPILGIAFDINNLGLISGVIFCSLLILLYLSMVREGRNLKTLFTHGWLDKNIDDRRLYELLSMYQVLTVPLKLYSPDKTYDKVTRMFIYGIFWFPVIILCAIFWYDLKTYDIGRTINPFLTFITTSSTLLMLLAVLFMVVKITERQIRIDRQWDNQYYRLNLEKLFNLKPNDADINVWTTPEQVKINWANTAEEVKRLQQENGRISEIHSVRLLENFIDNCYDDDFERLETKIDQRIVDSHWEHLQKWFADNKTKSTRREFRKSLKAFLNSSFEEKMA